MTYVVILAGGWGERFWPKSRLRYPKQFLSLDGKGSLLQKSINRFRPWVNPGRIRIVALKEQEGIFRKKYPSLRNRVYYEPFGRNTAAAAALAAFEIQRENPTATLVVLPCDQWVDDERAFRRSIREAVGAAERFDGVVTVGIPPEYPATGFGYICRKGALKSFGRGKAYRVGRFLEKPALNRAKQLLRHGSVYWNAGIFVFRIPAFMDLLKRHLPVLYHGFRNVHGAKDRTLFYRWLLARGFDTSFDVGILERTKKILVVPARFKWRDLGSWRAVEVVRPSSRGKNILAGAAYVEEGRENIFLSERGHLLAGIGISGLVAVHTKDATLIVPKERAEDVKRLTQLLRKQKAFRRYL